MRSLRTRAVVTSLTVSALLLGGCGSSGGVGGPDEAPQNTEEAVTLNYWTWFPPQATLDAAISAFESENPTITVNLRTFEGPDYQKQLPLALSGGEDIDVVGVQVSAMTNSVAEFLLPAEDWAGDWIGDINQTMRDQTQAIASDGVLYSVPMGSIGSPLMYYNAEILDSLDIAVPKTAAEWKTAVDAIEASNPDLTPVVFQGDPYWQEEIFFGIAEQTSPGLSDDIIGGDGSWDQPAVIEGLNAYKSLFDDGIISTDVLSLMGTRASELFSSGEAVFLIDGSWQNSLLSASYRETSGIDLADVGVTGIPVVGDGQMAVRSLAEGGLAIPAASKNVDAASAFIEFMLSSAGADVWAKDLVLVPSLTGYELSGDVLQSDAAKDGYATAVELLSAPTSARDSQQDFLQQIEGNAILDVLRGTVSAEEAAKRLQEEWTSGRYPHGSDQ